MEKTSIEIIKILKSSGHQAYWAGGCVRDMLLGIEPQDFDIVTSAKPDQIEKLLNHTIPIGKEFGVIRAIQNNHHFEIATFRSDSGYSDGRRPDAIEFTNPEEDAKRRDFSINGMFYDPLIKKVYDFVGGKKDLKEKLVRFIGDPHERILEDHLRILRAIRFKNTLNFQYHPDTYQAILKHANLANKVSGERVKNEVNKMFIHPNRIKSLEDLSETGVLKEIFPDLQNMKGVPQPMQYHHEGDVWDHSLLAVKSLPENTSLKVIWATLLHDIGKPDTFKIKERIRFDHHVERSAEIAQEMLRKIHFPKKEIDEICWTIKHHMMVVPLLEMPVGRQRHWCLHQYFPTLLAVLKADASGIEPVDLSEYKKIEDLYHDCKSHHPERPKNLISGDEVMKILNIKPGPKLGEILEEIHEKQLAKDLNTKEEAEAWIKDKS